MGGFVAPIFHWHATPHLRRSPKGVQSLIHAGGARLGLGRCPVRAQGSKVRFADQPPRIGREQHLSIRTGLERFNATFWSILHRAGRAEIILVHHHLPAAPTITTLIGILTISGESGQSRKVFGTA
jgi:hypothetical protein